MTYPMNIDDKYFRLVDSGVKKHEYRLYDEKRGKIQLHDTILLRNNSDPSLTVEVKVVGINVYKDWRSALKDTYKEDFAGLYNSLDECIKACSQFYKQEDIDKYGIVVYSIEKISER